MERTLILKLFVIFNCFLCTVAFTIKFTNLECRSMDKEFVLIKECRLKVVGRNKVSLNLHLNMLKLPIDNLKCRLQLLRKSHDYRPFLYNTSMDYCEFMKNGNKYLFWKILVDAVRPFTNLDQCPISHDVIIKNLILNENDLKLIPLPEGDYLFRMYTFSNGLKTIVNVYMTIK